MHTVDFERKLSGKHVLVTGHTGFSGAWSTLWLLRAGARVSGLALPPETEPNLYDALALDDEIGSTIGDIRDAEVVLACVEQTRPDLVLHLAAQPLVRRGYREPLETFASNTLGTAHVLEAARRVSSVRGVLCITTDKVYRNRNWPWPYRENDELGGRDPYSASKAAAELVIAAYRASYGEQGPAIASARGGNIIGGGDWSEDRLVPDFVRAVTTGHPLRLRYPEATRPWQHVLGLAQGYLMLLAGLLDAPETTARDWNLGPYEDGTMSVREVVGALADSWCEPELDCEDGAWPEAQKLALDCTLAREALGWRPPWNTRRTLAETAAWYRDYYDDPQRARAITEAQLDAWRQAIADED